MPARNKYWKHTEYSPHAGHAAWGGPRGGAAQAPRATATRQILRRHGNTFSPLLRVLFLFRH